MENKEIDSILHELDSIEKSTRRVRHMISDEREYLVDDRVSPDVQDVKRRYVSELFDEYRDSMKERLNL